MEFYGLACWMPPARPGDVDVGRYKAAAVSPIPPSPAAKVGERGGVGAVLCSNYRNHPPGKPGAFVWRLPFTSAGVTCGIPRRFIAFKV
jgi:hypothetical protein